MYDNSSGIKYNDTGGVDYVNSTDDFDNSIDPHSGGAVYTPPIVADNYPAQPTSEASKLNPWLIYSVAGVIIFFMLKK